MMLYIIMCISFFPVEINTQLLVLYIRILGKNRYIDNQKVQEADEIRRDIWKALA